MSKLFKLRDWLTLEEAVQYLKLSFGESVSLDDVLRLCLDEKLTLSVNFVHREFARFGRYVAYDQAKKAVVRLGPNRFVLKKIIEFDDYSELPPGWESKAALKALGYEVIAAGQHVRTPYIPMEFEEGFVPDNAGVLQFGDHVTEIIGVYDLPMIEGGRNEVLTRLNSGSSGTGLLSLPWKPACVCARDEEQNLCFFKLQWHIEDMLDDADIPKDRPWDHSDNFDSAPELPSSSQLVIRMSALREFENKISKPANQDAADNTSKPLHTRERDTYLKLIIGLAVKGFDYDPTERRSNVPNEIKAALDGVGISLDGDTIRDKLKQAAELLPGKK